MAEKIRELHKTGKRTTARGPLAVCLSKIDLLAGRCDPGAVSRFYDRLAQVDPTGERLDLPTIRARSRLTAHLLGEIWPDWPIEKQLGQSFGRRWMLFPITAVGLDGRGESDLRLRTIAPFGLLEPVLWLAEMNGYKLL